MPYPIKVSSVSPLVAGKKVTIDLDIGHEYLKIQLKRTNFTAVQATGFALKANGKIIQQLDNLQQMEDINTHYNLPQIAGVTTLYLTSPHMADSEDRDLNGLGTADARSLSIEFYLDGAVVAPDLEVEAIVQANRPMGWVRFLEVNDISLDKVGKNVISKMPTGSGNVNNYFLGKATQDITDVTLTRVVGGSKQTVLESTKEFLEINQAQAPMRPRVPVTASYTSLDFILSGVPQDALKTKRLWLNHEGNRHKDIKGTPEDRKYHKNIERIGMDITVATAEVLTVITESVGRYRPR